MTVPATGADGELDGSGDRYDRAPCGLAVIRRRGEIVAANRTLLDWLGVDRTEEAPRFHELLRVGDRIFWETNLGPLLDIQGEVREIAVELTTPGGPLPALVNARNRSPGHPKTLIDVAVFAAEDRRSYEGELLAARRQAEESEARARLLAETLQQSLIPQNLPVIPSIDLGAAYRPAGAGTEVGGDFYDVFQLSTADWMIAVGDVCGKGAAAAALTALARYTIRGAAMKTTELPEVLRAVNTTLRLDRSKRTCTALLGRVIPVTDGHAVTLCSAGHPLPRQVSASGEVAVVGRPGTLLGAFDEADQHEERVMLEPGGSLVFFTDGVTEARRGRDFFGEEGLHRVLAASAGQPASGLARAVADAAVEYQDGTARDDIAVVVVRQGEV